MNRLENSNKLGYCFTLMVPFKYLKANDSSDRLTKSRNLPICRIWLLLIRVRQQDVVFLLCTWLKPNAQGTFGQRRKHKTVSAGGRRAKKPFRFVLFFQICVVDKHIFSLRLYIFKVTFHLWFKENISRYGSSKISSK